MHTLLRLRIPAVIPVFRVARTSAKVKAAMLLAIFAMAYFAVASDSANAQSISSGAPTVRPGAAAERPAAPGGGAGAISSNPSIIVRNLVVDANSLKVRVDELERRVLELEKEKARLTERDRDELATKIKLEQRLAAVESALRDDGKGDKAAQIPGSSKSLGPQTVRAPFRVVDEGGRVVMRVEANSGRPRLTLGDPAAGGSALGVGESGAGFAVVRTATGSVGVALGAYEGGSMGVRVIGPDGRSVKGSLALDILNDGQLRLGNLDKAGVSIGVGQSGAGFVEVRRSDGKTGIALGQFQGRPMSVGVFGENAKELVTLGTGQNGGSVKVSTSAGAPVAALLAGETGGGVALTGPAGGKSAVSLTVEPNGGRVRVFPQAGGSTRAELFAGKSGGEVTVYNRGGEAVIWLEGTSQDQGRLQVGRAGKVYVEAGVVPSGVGIVATGPQVGGPPAGLVIPNYLRGRTGGK